MSIGRASFMSIGEARSHRVVIGIPTIVLILLAQVIFAQDKPAYKLFSKQGKAVSFGNMVDDLRKADVILFGELHDNAIAHWLELQVAKSLYAERKDVVLGMEMFEADDQIVLNEYLNGTIDERHLLNEAKVWDNYKNDYKPLVEFAKEKGLKVRATNVPRRYASLVYKKGMEALHALPPEAKQWIAPLPIEIDLTLPGYKGMMNMGGHGGAPGSEENMARSQAVKDATMAHFILQHREGLFIHYNGAYHSQNYEGIGWYLKKADPQIKMITIHTVEQEVLDKLDEAHKDAADFIICIPKDMTKTY